MIAWFVGKYCDPEVVTCVCGGVDTTTRLLTQPWGHVFFTGSTNVGKIVYQACAKTLSPVTLELGGKSPCYVSASANLKVTAKRIAATKFSNAGQTCIAPDYLVLHPSIKDEFIPLLRKYVQVFYPSIETTSKIVDEKNYDRIMGLLGGKEVEGANRQRKYIPPQLIDISQSYASHVLMEEEIFGPILPYFTMDEASFQAFAISRPIPLAMYYFGDGETGKEFLDACPSGGAMVNDCLLHISNPDLPFGGLGASGMGSYHGKAGFETFTHSRAMVIRELPNTKDAMDDKMRYPTGQDVPLGMLKGSLFKKKSKL